jgi:hypothetical protein
MSDEGLGLCDQASDRQKCGELKEERACLSVASGWFACLSPQVCGCIQDTLGTCVRYIIFPVDGNSQMNRSRHFGIPRHHNADPSRCLKKDTKSSCTVNDDDNDSEPSSHNGSGPCFISVNLNGAPAVTIFSRISSM